MKIIVHFGTAKTGTTSIQHSLAEARPYLLKHGILYAAALGNPTAHHLLSALFKQEHEVGPGLFQNYDNDYAGMVALADRNFDAIRKEVTRHKPEIVILSSESFFGFEEPDAMERFASRLRELGGQLNACVYIREPSSHYLSAVQQMAKGRPVLKTPKALAVRQKITDIGEAFGTPVLVRPFAREKLVNGDVVKDFVSANLGSVIEPGSIQTITRNESQSPEVADLLFQYRAFNAPDQNHLRPTGFKMFWDMLLDIEKKHGHRNKPTLLPELKTAIIRASTELLWLRDEYGIEYSGIDYALVDGTPIPDIEAYRTPGDVMVLDREWRDRLLFETIARLQEKPGTGTLYRVGKALGLR